MNPISRHLVMDLAHAPLSVSEAAARARLNLGKAHYRIKRLEAAGLVRVASETPRCGRPVKRYKAVASRFHLPTVEASAPADEIRERIVRRIDAEAGGGLWIEADADGARRMRPAAPAGGGGTLQACLQLSLTSAERDAFRAELDALFRKYRGGRPGVRGARPHMLWLGLAPGEVRGGP